METANLVAVALPHSRYVIRVKNGRRLGTVFSGDEGWYYQFDGTPQEGPRCDDADEALRVMEAVAAHQRLIPSENE